MDSTYETSNATVSAARPFAASTKAVVPRTAQPGSISESWARKNNRSSYGIGMLAKVICEQLFVFVQGTTRKAPTERSRRGMDMHKEFLSLPETGAPYKPRELPFTTPEEEAAHIFIYVPAAIRALLKYNYRVEFKVFGYHFDRAFDGSIDSVEAVRKEKVTILTLHEVKTAVGTSLGEEPLRRAQLQTSLYVFFLREMLRREPFFDFEAYFKARGLNPNRKFDPNFAAIFPSHQVYDMNPDKLPPANLNTLVDQWRDWLNTLPEILIDNNVYITTLKTARISGSSGFGQHPKVEVKVVPHDVNAALEIGQTVIDLLDGRKTPTGLGNKYTPFCTACEFHTKCPWTPQLWRRPVEPLRIPIRSTLPEEIKQIIMAPSPRPVDPTPPAAADQNIGAAMQDERRRSKAHLEVLFKKLLLDLNPVERKRSAVTQELTSMKKEQEVLSVVERIRRARLAVAHEKAEKRKAAKQAQKIAAIQLATQRKAQRAAIKNQEKSQNQKPFIGLVPYVAPTQATTDIVIYKPSLSRVRLKRRQQKQVSAVNIPIGGQAVPEDETYSIARLHVPADNAEKWTYQFDALPSLAEQQAEMLAKEAKEPTTRVGRLTDVELEDMARQARRAQRRKDRGAVDQ